MSVLIHLNKMRLKHLFSKGLPEKMLLIEVDFSHVSNQPRPSIDLIYAYRLNSNKSGSMWLLQNVCIIL